MYSFNLTDFVYLSSRYSLNVFDAFYLFNRKLFFIPGVQLFNIIYLDRRIKTNTWADTATGLQRQLRRHIYLVADRQSEWFNRR